jgi:predicted SnoaL-like aldol condensation-catalyzing enzyme
MYREILQGGRFDLVDRYFTEEYLQHNPNVGSGRQALADFIKGSRPVRPINPTITLPLITMIAEGDWVMVASQRPMKDESGEPYVTTWFDLYLIRDGKIAEHWDPALKSAEMLRFDPNSIPAQMKEMGQGGAAAGSRPDRPAPKVPEKKD